MDPLTLATASAAISGGTNITSNLIGAGGSFLGNIYSYRKNLQQWNRANEYNLPINQMARLKQAGLNPNLVYGSGAGQVQAVNSPQMDVPKFHITPPDIMGAYMQALQVGKQMQQIDQNIAVQKAQENYLNQKALTEGSNSLLKSLQATLFDKTMSYQSDAFRIKRDVLLQQLDNFREQNKAIKAGIRIQNLEALIKAVDLGKQRIDLSNKQQGLEKLPFGIGNIITQQFSNPNSFLQKMFRSLIDY